MAIPETIKKLANDIRTKIYGREVREALAQGIEEAGSLANEANTRSIDIEARQDDLERRWDDVIQNATETDPSSVEIVDARGGYSVLRERLDAIDEQLEALTINVKNFGAVGDGITDDTQAFQSAIDYINSKGGGTLYIPNGTYIISALDLCSNISIKGQSWKTKLKQLNGFTGRWDNPNYPISTYPKKVDGLLIVNGNDIIPSSNYENISISNLCLEGNSVENGFFETLNLLAIYAANNVIIERCKFVAPQGDAILLGSNHVEQHISNVIIRDCYFDGINYQNRQAISIMEGDHILIENNYFTRFTNDNMPGAICIESNNDSWAIVRNITIKNNIFYKIGTSGSKPAVVFVIDDYQNVVETQKNIIIEENYFEDCTCVRVQGRINPTINSKPNNVIITNNHGKNLYKAFIIAKAKGVYISKNTINGTLFGSDIGSASSDNTEMNFDIYIENNDFYNDAKTNGYGIVIRSGENINIIRNKFQDSGLLDGTRGYGIYLAGENTNLHINDNNFISTGIMTHGIFVASTHNSDWRKNSFNGNIYSGPGMLGTLPAIKSYGDIYFNGANKVNFSTANVANDFPIGLTIAYVNDNGVPSNTKAGILMVIKTGKESLNEVASTIQFFFPVSSENRTLYWRNSDASGTVWSTWSKITGVPI